MDFLHRLFWWALLTPAFCLKTWIKEARFKQANCVTLCFGNINTLFTHKRINEVIPLQLITANSHSENCVFLNQNVNKSNGSKFLDNDLKFCLFTRKHITVIKKLPTQFLQKWVVGAQKLRLSAYWDSHKSNEQQKFILHNWFIKGPLNL